MTIVLVAVIAVILIGAIVLIIVGMRDASEGDPLQERLAEALMSAREAKIVSESVQKELRAGMAAQKVELESTTQALKSEMNTLKRATTNRLGQ